MLSLLLASCSLLLGFTFFPCLVQLVFDYFRQRTPRSYIEVRDTALVWNYKYAGMLLCVSVAQFPYFTVPNTHIFLGHKSAVGSICVMLY